MSDDQSSQPETLSIASELIRARTERGFSQAHLAEVSGVSRSAIKAYETGRSVPGSRELRALCIALKVTPNKLLFGTDAPTFEEGDAPRLEALIRSDPEGKALTRSKLAMMADLLTTDEAAALLLLAQSVATARHGPEKVRQVTVGATLMAGLMRFMVEAGAKAERTGEAITPDASATYLEDFMVRNGVEPPLNGDGLK